MPHVPRKYITIVLFFSSGLYAMQVDQDSVNNNGRYAIGLSCRQGRRPEMEDSHVIIEKFGGNSEELFCAIYDGHGGEAVAEYAAKHLHKRFQENTAPTIVDRFKEVFEQVDKEILANDGYHRQGTTALVAYCQNKVVHCAWAGDSRAVLARRKEDGSVGGYVQTTDHKPEFERKRIEAAGGFVYRGRVNGSIATSRALGDRYLKHAKGGSGLTSEPQVVSWPVKSGDVMVMACDGLWDKILSSQAALYAHNLNEGQMFLEPGLTHEHHQRFDWKLSNDFLEKHSF